MMANSMLVIILMCIPLAATLVLALLPAKTVARAVFETVHILSLLGVGALGLYLAVTVMSSQTPIDAVDLWFHLDTLGAIFVALICVLGFITGLYSVPFVNHESKLSAFDASQVKRYYVFFSLCLFTMLLLVLSNNLIMIWVAVEATTLATAFLVGAYKTRQSLEASWKYLIVCTVGVAFGLYGTVLIYANAAEVMADPHQAAFLTSILPYVAEFDPMIMQIAFVFAAIGFGTKAGLFPMHTWMPDAYSEAPSPVSALLSGVLSKCAVLVVIRFYSLTMLAVGPQFPQTLLLILGILSVVMSAFAVLVQKDIKRLLAYSSCENIGVIALCLGFGGPLGIAAALLHCITHGLTKTLLFCATGNIQMKYGTRELAAIKGFIRVAPISAVILTVGFFGLAGFPPLAMFISEILAFISGVMAGHIVLVVCFGIALTIVIAACVRVVAGSVFDKAPETVKPGELGAMTLVPQLLLVGIIVWFGVAMPKPVLMSIESASAVVLQVDDTETALAEAPLFGELFAHSGQQD